MTDEAKPNIRVIVLNCGHEHRIAGAVTVGQDWPCWSACDFVGKNITTRRVMEVRNA